MGPTRRSRVHSRAAGATATDATSATGAIPSSTGRFSVSTTVRLHDHQRRATRLRIPEHSRAGFSRAFHFAAASIWAADVLSASAGRSADTGTPSGVSVGLWGGDILSTAWGTEVIGSCAGNGIWCEEIGNLCIGSSMITRLRTDASTTHCQRYDVRLVQLFRLRCMGIKEFRRSSRARQADHQPADQCLRFSCS